MKIVSITIAGTCNVDYGPGGWACILRHGESASERAGGDRCTTKRRMELQAVIESLQALREPCEVFLHSDNQHLLNGILYWRNEWRLTNFVWMSKRLRDFLPDNDLWSTLDTIAEKHLIRSQFISANFSHPDKERCDKLAEAQATLHLGVPS
jgi:ribonuclease HI